MSKTALVNGTVVTPAGIRSDLAVVIADGRILSVGDAIPSDAQIRDLEGRHLLPGFIDLQVNGGGGKLFNDDPAVDTLRTIASAHRRFGTTGLLPTLISDSRAKIATAIAAVDEAIAAGVPGILGIHIEGPFIAPDRKGIHLEGMLQTLQDSDVDLLSAGRLGRTLVTLAPECAKPALIRALCDRGVIVTLGHSNATYEQTQAAIEAGATGCTHLFNAMSQLANRAPGLVGAVLASDDLFAGLIVDGHHLHPATVRIARRAVGCDRLMLVSDAMSVVGTDERQFHLQGRTINHRDGRLYGEGGTLAGSSLNMADAVAQFMQQTGATLDEAVKTASLTPARFIGLDHSMGRIAPGARADLICVDHHFSVCSSWIGGEVETYDSRQ